MEKTSKITVVTPTYNEKSNLRPLVEGIFELGVPNIRMVVVDDNSPDGTGILADTLAQTYPITVLHREEKAGLGTAYVAAFSYLLDLPPKECPDYIIQMDADLSHDPRVIPAMLNAISSCDLVLGSRYVPGGGIENWDAVRKLVSKFGNIYARVVLRSPYHDLTGGYKCYRASVLRTLDLPSLSSVGYNFQIETTHKAHAAGFRITEIPILFTERKTGVSKFNIGIMMESFWKVLRMRFHDK